MTKILTTIFICISIISFGQESNNKSSNDITTTKTNKHLNIPGTRVFIIPPLGFVTSTKLPAIENGNKAIIQAMDLIGGSFYTNAATFSRKKFELKGLKVLEYKEFKLNKYPAKMVLIQGESQTKMYNLVFGDSTFSTTVMGVFESNDNETGIKIKQALQSIYYDKTFEVTPFANSHFKLDDTKSIFKFAKFSTLMYTYSINGIIKDSYDNEPYFTVITIPIEGMSLKSIADFIANMIKVETTKNISENNTNGLISFKREVYGKLKGKEIVLFQHVVIIDESAVIMQGIADDKFDKYIAEFEKLSNTVVKK